MKLLRESRKLILVASVWKIKLNLFWPAFTPIAKLASMTGGNETIPARCVVKK